MKISLLRLRNRVTVSQRDDSTHKTSAYLSVCQCVCVLSINFLFIPFTGRQYIKLRIYTTGLSCQHLHSIQYSPIRTYVHTYCILLVHISVFWFRYSIHCTIASLIKKVLMTIVLLLCICYNFI